FIYNCNPNAMVNACFRMAFVVGLLLPLASAQNPTDLERRVRDLEAKMRLLDPAFGSGVDEANLATRLTALESKMEQLLAARSAPSSPEPEQSSPLKTLSVTGDYQSSGGGETRLPVSGYMDFH